MHKHDYRQWLPELLSTTLFRDIDDEDLIALLEAMAPAVISLKAGEMYPPQIPAGCFLMYLKSEQAQANKPRRFKWDMPKHGEPGALMGEIPNLCNLREGLNGNGLLIFKKRPLVAACDLLELTADMLLLDFDDKQVRRAQNTMLRNLMGILSQKVMDVRQDLWKLKFDVDIYDMQDGDKEKLSNGLMG